MAATTRRTELAVIGAGPAGYPAAFRAADMGMKVTLIDPEENPGGVCLFRGCIPSKALLHVARLYEETQAAADWGLDIEGAAINPAKLQDWKNAVIQRLTGGLGQLVKQRGIDYMRGTARFQDRNTLDVALTDGGATDVHFENAIVATGSEAVRIPAAPDSPRVMTSRQALDIEDVPDTLLIVGGGYIGLELGQVYASLGSAVTVVEMLPDILAGCDRDLVTFLEKRLRRQFEAIRTETKVVEMTEEKNGIRVRMDGKNAPDDAPLFNKVMLAVGRRPLTRGLNLDGIGVKLTGEGFIDVDAQRRSSVDNIFAVGDVAGPPMLAHKGTHEAPVAVEAIAGRKTVFEPRAIPFVVFSDPEIAWCGLNEVEAAKQGHAYETATFPWAASGRATTLGRNDGLTKLLVDPETRRILGAGIVGTNAGELIGQAVIAMEMGAVADDLALSIQPHPTLSETLMEAAEAAAFGSSTHRRRRKRDNASRNGR